MIRENKTELWQIELLFTIVYVLVYFSLIHNKFYSENLINFTFYFEWVCCT